jgi:hypothetical protein
MRRQLREGLPAFAAFYGLKPWEIAGGPPVLTFGEIDEFARQLPKKD